VRAGSAKRKDIENDGLEAEKRSNLIFHTGTARNKKCRQGGQPWKSIRGRAKGVTSKSTHQGLRSKGSTIRARKGKKKNLGGEYRGSAKNNRLPCPFSKREKKRSCEWSKGGGEEDLQGEDGRFRGVQECPRHSNGQGDAGS